VFPVKPLAAREHAVALSSGMETARPIRLAIVRCGTLDRQHHITTLCRFLASNGFEIAFFALQTTRDDTERFASQVPGMRALCVGEWRGKGLARFVRGGMALRRALRNSRFDILYAVDSWTLRYLAVATRGAMRWDKRPLVYHTFDMLAPHVAAAADILLERHAAGRSGLNVNADRSRAAVMQSLYGLKRTPLAVPLRLTLDSVLPARDESLRASLFRDTAQEPEFVVVNPTRASGERMTKEIIAAFRTLPTNYRLVTVDGPGDYGRECRALIEQAGISKRVRVLDPMPHDELLKICSSSDVCLIFHNAGSSLGNHLAHPGRLAYCVALGLPVVANNIPVLESVVYRHGLGECCNPEPAAIAAAIRRVCEGDPPLRERAEHIRTAFRKELHYERAASALPPAIRELARQDRS